MFNKEELEYLFVAVDQKPAGNTNIGRAKAHMLAKISDLLDSQEKVDDSSNGRDDGDRDPNRAHVDGTTTD